MGRNQRERPKTNLPKNKNYPICRTMRNSLNSKHVKFLKNQKDVNDDEKLNITLNIQWMNILTVKNKTVYLRGNDIYIWNGTSETLGRGPRPECPNVPRSLPSFYMHVPKRRQNIFLAYVLRESFVLDSRV